MYPPNIGFDHTTYAELKAGIINNFKLELINKKIQDQRLIQRFNVFCFKHDLEALVLASENQLRKSLGLKANQAFPISWTIPVENQNHDHPPSRILENLFKSREKTYNKKKDSVLILENVDYHEIAEKCDQCFKPFIEFIEKLTA